MVHLRDVGAAFAASAAASSTVRCNDGCIFHCVIRMGGLNKRIVHWHLA